MGCGMERGSPPPGLSVGHIVSAESENEQVGGRKAVDDAIGRPPEGETLRPAFNQVPGFPFSRIRIILDLAQAALQTTEQWLVLFGQFGEVFRGCGVKAEPKGHAVSAWPGHLLRRDIPSPAS